MSAGKQRDERGFTPAQRAVLNAFDPYFGEWVDGAVIMKEVYGDKPRTRPVLRVTIFKMKKTLRYNGLVIEGRKKGRGGRGGAGGVIGEFRCRELTDAERLQAVGWDQETGGEKSQP